jgi:hypothetical protein
MLRHWLLLGVASLAASAYDQRSIGRGGAERNVIVVVSDGLRWQEVFTGADSALIFGDPASLGGDGVALRARYWRTSAAERRAVLMPFVWSQLARDGQLRGNRELESHVDVTNPMKFSYPGYNEMLTGAPDARIDRNDYGPNPNVTVFEWLNRRREFKGRVAAFGTWDTFRDIFNVERSGIFMRTTPARPYDAVVHGLVMPHLEKGTTRALFVGYAETDDWGHQGRYDRFLDAVHAVDGYLAELWREAQSNPRYRGKTTIIFTADHGRGRGPADWKNHGRDIPGSAESFIVTIGPGVDARGERRGTSNELGDVARATAAALGLTFSAREPVAASR